MTYQIRHAPVDTSMLDDDFSPTQFDDMRNQYDIGSDVPDHRLHAVVDRIERVSWLAQVRRAAGLPEQATAEDVYVAGIDLLNQAGNLKGNPRLQSVEYGTRQIEALLDLEHSAARCLHGMRTGTPLPVLFEELMYHDQFRGRDGLTDEEARERASLAAAGLIAGLRVQLYPNSDPDITDGNRTDVACCRFLTRARVCVQNLEQADRCLAVGLSIGASAEAIAVREAALVV